MLKKTANENNGNANQERCENRAQNNANPTSRTDLILVSQFFAPATWTVDGPDIADGQRRWLRVIGFRQGKQFTNGLPIVTVK